MPGFSNVAGGKKREVSYIGSDVEHDITRFEKPIEDSRGRSFVFAGDENVLAQPIVEVGSNAKSILGSDHSRSVTWEDFS